MTTMLMDHIRVLQSSFKAILWQSVKCTRTLVIRLVLPMYLGYDCVVMTCLEQHSLTCQIV